MSSLLFFDTFSHGNTNVLQLDLVQFNKPVHVTEVRVIPLGARVKADFPGGVRLGATNPSVFDIEFYVNDMSKKGAATFESLGLLHYSQQRNIHLEVEKRLPTDGLLLRGNYNAITLAVYGSLAKLQRDPSPKPQQKPLDTLTHPPVEKVNTHERIRDWLEETQPRSPVEFDKSQSWEDEKVQSEKDCSSLDQDGSSPMKSHERTRGGEQRSFRRNARRDRQWERDKGIWDADSDRDCDWTNEDNSRKRENFGRRDDEMFGQDDVGSKVLKTAEDWDEHRSERSDRSVKATHYSPHNRVGPLSPYPETGFSEEEKQTCSEKEEKKDSHSILPPISADEMEAISDDEDIPDLPADAEEVEDDYMMEEGVEENDHLGEGVPRSGDGNEENDSFSFEEIISDEEELPEYHYEDDYIIDEWEDWLRQFIPEQNLNFSPLVYFHTPSLNKFELEVQKERTCFHEDKQKEDPLQIVKFNGLMNHELPWLPNKGSLLNIEERDELGKSWVNNLEQINQLISTSLPYIMVWKEDKSKEILTTVIDWAFFGISYEEALLQKEPIYKIRHLKAGIKLSLALLQCSSDISKELLSKGLQRILFELYYKEHMALSLKLLIVSTIDAITWTSVGLHYFIGHPVEGLLREEQTGYEKLLEMMVETHQSRAKFAIAAVLRKISCLEVLQNINEHSVEIHKIVSSLTKECEPKMDCFDANINDKINLQNINESSFQEPLISSLNSNLQYINRCYKFANQLLAQPHRFVPGLKQFQLPKSLNDAYPLIYLLFDETKFLQSIAVIASSCPSLDVMKGIRDLLFSIMSLDHGIQYLMSHMDVLPILIQSFLQYDDGVREDLSELNFGVYITCCMYAVQQIDFLTHVASQKEINYFQAATYFNNLSSLLLNNYSTVILVDVLLTGRFVEFLFSFLKFEPDNDPDINPSKLACFSYATELLTLAVKFSDKVEILEPYAGKFYDAISTLCSMESGKSEEVLQLSELLPYLSVLRVPENFTYDHFAKLSSLVEEQLEFVEKFPGELLSCLRIIRYLMIPIESTVNITDDQNLELVEELKYKYAVVQLFSADLPTHLVNVLKKISALYSQPFVYSFRFIEPCLVLLKNFLSYVIEARNTNFKDLSAVIPLLQTYLLLQNYSTSSPCYRKAQLLMQEVIGILLVYTQPIYSLEGEQSLSNSLWTQMMAEVLKYMMTTPNAFIGIINVLIELLPHTLPIQSSRPLTDEEVAQAITLRKLWSAHLDPVSSNIHEIILKLAITSYPPLVLAVSRLLFILSDLSAPMALLSARAVLDLVLQTHKIDQKTSGEEASVGICSGQTARVLSLLVSFVSHSPCKAAVVHLLRGMITSLSFGLTKQDEKYTSLLPVWCQILSLYSNSESHITAQENLIYIFNCFCNYENTMLPFSESLVDDVISEQRTNSKALKFDSYGGCLYREILIPVLDALFMHLQSSQSQYSTLQQIFTILLQLLEHDYGFFYIKCTLDKKKLCLYLLLKRLSENYDCDTEDIIPVLQNVLDFFALFLNCDNNLPWRTFELTLSRLAYYIGWKSQNLVCSKYITGIDILTYKEKCDNEIRDEVKTAEDNRLEESEQKKEEDVRDHPLRLLENLVVADREQEITEALYEDITSLILLLENESDITQDISKEYEEPQGPNSESIQTLFASRLVWTYPSKEEKIFPFWLFSNICDEEGDDVKMVTTDLLDMCKTYTIEYNIKEALSKLIKGQENEGVTQQKGSPSFKTSVTATKSRSFARNNARGDLFRSRAPNTSRPPSLHVDDFVALESTGQQPTGPTGYNKISFGRGKLILENLRGKTRGKESKSRFFNRPGFRGDSNRASSKGANKNRNAAWGGSNFRGDSSRGNFSRSGPGRFSRGNRYRGNASKERFSYDKGRRDGANSKHKAAGFR